MKRINILTAVLVAAFAVSVVVVASAAAVEFLLALWLDGGVAVSAELLVETEGEVELVSLNGGGLGVVIKVLCSGIFVGSIGPESLGFASELLTLGGVAVPLAELTGTALLCTNIQNCTEPELWASKLGWEGEAELMVDGTETFFVALGLNGGWYSQCLVLGITTSETCTAAEAVSKLTNEANGTIDGEGSDAFQILAGLKLGNCTVGGAESAEVNGLGIGLESGVTLSVSSE